MLERIFVEIYHPANRTTQSAPKVHSIWKIKFPSDNTKYSYDLMSWTGSKDTRQQLDLTFPSKEKAIAFAKKQNWEYTVIQNHKKKIYSKSYANNFIS